MTSQDNTPLTGTPAQWRKEKGFSAHYVADFMQKELHEETRHFTSVTKMEKEGSQKSSAVRAYAKALNVDFLQALEIFESISLKNNKKKSLISKIKY